MNRATVPVRMGAESAGSRPRHYAELLETFFFFSKLRVELQVVIAQVGRIEIFICATITDTGCFHCL